VSHDAGAVNSMPRVPCCPRWGEAMDEEDGGFDYRWWVRRYGRVIRLTGVSARVAGAALRLVAVVAFSAPKGHPVLERVLPRLLLPRLSWINFVAVLLVLAAIGVARWVGGAKVWSGP
jgi:hypothetical protein